jgi:hypothetical protein
LGTSAIYNGNSIAGCDNYNLTSCIGGYWAPVISQHSQIDGQSVGAGYWSAAGATTRTACATGLTTVGYGAGADEFGDCGRVLHYGDNLIYLRNAKKTNPSLNISINGTIYYGNMSAAVKGNLKINYVGTTYFVYDDSQDQ